MKISDLTDEEFFSRSNLINYLIGLYGYRSYLEIGVDNGMNFERVNCAYKIGVDPSDNYDKITFNITSDEFFAQNNDKFDIVFIDGLHVSDQVVKDIANSLDVLNPLGTIVMHDCLPNSEFAQSRERLGDHWNGDVWKAFAHYRQNPDLVMFTANTDQGLGVIKRGKQKVFDCPEDLDYSFYVNNVDKMMNVVNVSTCLDLIRKLNESGY